MLEQAMQETLHEFIVTWMQRHALADAQEADYDTAALIMSWAFIVVGMRWGRSDRSRQAEELAAQVVGVLTYGVSALRRRPAANDLLIERRR
jgi:hypothetical protein